MSGGTRGAAGRGRGRGNVPEENVDLPPPPTMVQLMAMYEANRTDRSEERRVGKECRL